MQTLTLSSKNQITIPVSFSKILGLKKGQRILIEKKNQSLILTPYKTILERLSGRIKVKKEIKNMNEIISKAKKNHFSKKVDGQ